jgi:putative FmdB family regulatory protein
MAIYQYKCRECGEISEYRVSMQSDNPVLSCASCGSLSLDKLISAPAAITSGRSPSAGHTCCGRTERCETPPCSDGGCCGRH